MNKTDQQLERLARWIEDNPTRFDTIGYDDTEDAVSLWAKLEYPDTWETLHYDWVVGAMEEAMPGLTEEQFLGIIAAVPPIHNFQTHGQGGQATLFVAYLRNMKSLPWGAFRKDLP